LSKTEIQRATGFLRSAEVQLGEYFTHQRTVFDVELDLHGTPFQIEVWKSLARIPYGKTTSYGQQARWVGRPAAVRAVGGANGRNPVAIVLPCHRVVGANGSLTGFGGGLERKTWLLELERWK
jgi:methylated-DNA-[protein]-cysteine S-methyltransferase